MDFIKFKQAVAKQFNKMKSHTLFTVEVDKDKLWETYLSSFPEGTNPIYRERTEHDCSCCRQFIRAVGNVVAIIDGKLETIWDINGVDDAYQTVANHLSYLVRNQPIDNLFFSVEKTAGTDKNFEQLVDQVKTWEHFFVNIPNELVKAGPSIGPALSECRSTYDVMLRGLSEITIEALETVLELISQNSLYRGQEHQQNLSQFLSLKKKFDQADNKIYFVWSLVKSTPFAVSRIRNTSIGTLLVELSEGVELETAVKRFEAMVAPANYKRPTALVTKAQVEKAKKTIEELGMTSALERRYAKLNDISINNVLFANREARKSIEGSVFDEIETSTKTQNFSKVEEVGIDHFLSKILPTATGLEVFVENKHTPNLVSLIAPSDPTAVPLFKWNNGFSWSYNGDVADSLKERVKAAGGNVTGDVCCRLAWEYTDDLDFHMEESHGSHIAFNNRTSRNGGRLDVDANGGNGMMEHPVENIYYESINTMANGEYRLFVHNWSRRSNGVGFEVEIDIMGTVHSFAFNKVIGHGKRVDVATLVKKGNVITVQPHLPANVNTKSNKVWGVDTQNFVEASAVMFSPNYWDDNAVGNKHVFFMLKGCENEGNARGFYNEFLKAELNEHRKVMELVGSKMRTETGGEQMSGLGFSTTQKNELLVKVKGSFNRVVKVVF